MNYETVTIAGQDHAILPLDQLIALQEMAQGNLDAADYDFAKSHADEFFPIEVIDRIKIDGEAPLKVYREYRKMTQAALADAAGISRSYLTKIETKRQNGSVSVIRKIAVILDIDIALLT